MILLAIIAGGIYVLVIASFYYGWIKLEPFEVEEDGSIFVSVVIPVRNEEKNIQNLLHCLKQQSLPSQSFEIIIVNDHSTDKTLDAASFCNVSNLKILSLTEEESGKKAALSLGIKHSIGEIIVTTDADCQMGNNWLQSIAACYKNVKPVMILAPVVPMFHYETGYRKSIEQVMALEMFSLLGSTAGSASIGTPVMCNGANLAFSREVLPSIEHSYTSSSAASGDDIFGLLALKKKYPGRIHYLKSTDASVYTGLEVELKSFLKQRGRWTSKARLYKDPAIIVTALTVFGMNFLLLITLVYGCLSGNYFAFILLIVAKSVIDFPLLWSVTSFFNKKKLMWWFPLAQGFYFIYVCVTVFYGFVIPNVWKGRRI